MFRYRDIYNIFCDASTTPHDQPNFTVVPGCLIVKNNKLISKHFEVLHNTSHNYGELYAIYLGICELDSLDLCDEVNIFSDSLSSINAIKNDISKWYDNNKDKDHDEWMTKSSTRDVILETKYLYLQIIKKLVSKGIKINLYHTLSHVDPRNQIKLQKFIKTFHQKNCIPDDEMKNIDPNVFDSIICWNNCIDSITRIYLKAHQYKSDTELPRSLEWFPIDKDMETYCNLIA